jgi:NADPH-dependent 2,4-dienoyl-CoA reductase/sulfur reductase-like enzyme/Fe-S-cluster-containing hydrogenase component 2
MEMGSGRIMKTVDILIIGAGPSGLGAAIEARRYGAEVLLVDDKDKPGGQLFKQIHKFFGSKEHRAGVRGFDIGFNLLNEAESLGVKIHLNTKVLGIMENKEISLLIDDNEVEILKSKCIILATGAIEKPLSFPGWTLPGVMTAGAAQTLTNIERVLPGEKILMIGSGNVGLIVSYQLLQAGANIIGAIEALPNISGYAVHAGKILRAGVPIYTGYTVKEARGKEHVEEADIIKLDENWNYIDGTEKTFQVDTICMAVGLMPNTHLARMAECELKYFSNLGGFLPLHDSNMESSQKGIYVAGDLAGVEEANTALDEGRLAGISAAYSLAYIKEEKYKELKDEFNNRLNKLRNGPFAYNRAVSKKKIISYNNKNKIIEKEVKKNTNDSLQQKDDIFLLDNIMKLPGYPSLNRIKEGAVACIECVQEIPCNPCVEACPYGAITIDKDITGIPRLDEDKCKGCGLCITQCPGQAIFLIDYKYSKKKGSISFPFEFLPHPDIGSVVDAVNRQGEVVTKAEIIKIDDKKIYDKTPIVTITVPKEYIHQVRSIKRGELNEE